MEQEALKLRIQEIVKQAKILKDKHTSEKDAKVNYACIFSHTKEEFDELVLDSELLGRVIKETPTGPLFHIEPIETVSGHLKLLKIRVPDETRPERGDADFTVENYDEFSKENLSKRGFKLIKRENMEMIELMDEEFGVRAYFSHPPLDEQLGVK